jgi:hypothetical protein
MLVSGVRTIYASALLLAPGPLVEAASGQPPDDASVLVARVLGARQAAQAAATAPSPTAWRLRLGAAADVAHAASMAALGVVDNHRRRLAWADAMVAAAFAAAGLRAADAAAQRERQQFPAPRGKPQSRRRPPA